MENKLKLIIPPAIRPALLLDLDGTVRRNRHDHKSFINGVDDIELMPGIEEKIKGYKEKDYLIFGISNQGGVAHGYKTIDDVVNEMRYTSALFELNPFDYIIFCPYDDKGKVEPYNVRSLLRKPETGMLAVAEYIAVDYFKSMIDWNNSLFVGDRPEDQQCATAAGVPFQWIHEFLELPF